MKTILYSLPLKDALRTHCGCQGQRQRHQAREGGGGGEEEEEWSDLSFQRTWRSELYPVIPQQIQISSKSRGANVGES